MRRQRLHDYDRFFRKFQYANALDAALARRDPLYAISVLAELTARDGLHSALARRDEAALEPLLKFLVRHINDARFAALLCDVTLLALDMYATAIGASPATDALWLRLAQKLRTELEFQASLQRLQGSVALLCAAGRTIAPERGAAQ